jgi:leader peptidase (prepilin peptidase)/N-methyltransferase
MRYPLVELLCGLLFAATAARFARNWELPAFLVLFAGLLALSCIDIERYILPKKIVYPLSSAVALLLLIAAALTHEWRALVVAIVCAAVWFVVFLSLNLASPRLLGFGDVRLAPLLGLALGWLGVRYALLGFFAANLIGAVVGIALIATHKIGRQQRLPYGVFLALGLCVAVFAGPELLRPFSSY